MAGIKAVDIVALRSAQHNMHHTLVIKTHLMTVIYHKERPKKLILRNDPKIQLTQ